MNTAAYTQQPQPLFAHCQHAGGWPKLGFEASADSDDSATDTDQE